MTQKLQNRVLGPKESWHTDEEHFCWTLNCYLFNSEGVFVVGWFYCWWIVGYFCRIITEEAEAV